MTYDANENMTDAHVWTSQKDWCPMEQLLVIIEVQLVDRYNAFSSTNNAEAHSIRHLFMKFMAMHNRAKAIHTFKNIFTSRKILPSNFDKGVETSSCMVPQKPSPNGLQL